MYNVMLAIHWSTLSGCHCDILLHCVLAIYRNEMSHSSSCSGLATSYQNIKVAFCLGRVLATLNCNVPVILFGLYSGKETPIQNLTVTDKDTCCLCVMVCNDGTQN